MNDGNFDEIIISTLSKRTSRWLRRDLFHRVETLGLPVKVITPRPSGENVSELETVAGKGGSADGMLGM
jgi:hypothetical protein